MYARYIKRIIDFALSLLMIIILSPVFLSLTIIGTITMKGNPFFIQDRPGKSEKIFKLIKFRTMTNEKDSSGNLLPDENRLIPYGKFLRSTSLDEIPELFNILFGQMAFIGPRPLLPLYLLWYTEEQSHRHDVKPGLTGYAQAHGRNAINWDERFELDIWYTKHISFATDVKILVDTVKVVLKREGISSESSATMENFVDYCKTQGRKPRY